MVKGRVVSLVLLPVFVLGVLPAGLLAGCGSDEAVSPTGDIATGGTGTTVVVSTVPSSAVVSSSTSVSSTTVSSTTDAVPSSPAASSSDASTTSTTARAPEASGTTTEVPSSAETLLSSGRIQAMGYIDAVWESGGVRHLSIRYAKMLTGRAAVDAAVETGYIAPGEDLPNDYFIIDGGSQLHEFTVSPSVAIATVTFGNSMEKRSVGWAEFMSFWTSSAPAGAEHLSDMPWQIEREGREVLSITEQYLP
jgi:hypothetical protein